MERSVWQADRRGLDERIASAQAAFDEQRRLWDATREVLDQEVALYRAREEQERGELERLRQSQFAHDRQLQEASDRVEQLTDASAHERTRLAEEVSRSAVRLDRLQNSDLFGYTLMTTDGHLIRCNDVFAAGSSDTSTPKTRSCTRTASLWRRWRAATRWMHGSRPAGERLPSRRA